MKKSVIYSSLLILVGCASNEKPAEIVTPRGERKLKPLATDAYYLVKPGDTLLSIASRFGLKPSALSRLNELPEGARAIPGQRLVVKPRNLKEERLLGEEPDGIRASLVSEEPKPLDEASSPRSEELSGDAPESARGEFDDATNRPSTVSTGEYVLPVRGKIVKPFGVQPDGTVNKGVNIAAPKGIPVKAVADGVVKYAGNKAEGYGKMIMIKHYDGRISTYAHLNSIDSKVGSAIKAGGKIGTIGSTGNVSRPQLQLQIRGTDKAPIDPSTLIDGIGN